ncbi:MAG: hypothetical protein AAGA05_03205 [Pseudomonadota bacterium]
MLGWRLFKHAFLMVLRNFVPALQIFLVPSILAFAVIMGVAYATGFLDTFPVSETDVSSETSPADLGTTVMLTFVVAGTTMLLFVAWTVVAWHRFVLLEEYPSGWLPPLRTDRVGAYIWRLVILALAAIAMIFPASLLFFVSSAPAIMTPVVLVYMVFLSITLTRWSITLPAAAIGKPLTLGEAYAETSGAFGTILVVLLSGFVLGLLLQGVSWLFIQVPAIYTVWNVPTQIFTSVLNVSIITTLYGHYVEKREID